MHNNCNLNTIVKQDFAVVKQVDRAGGTHDRRNSATELAEHTHTPDHAYANCMCKAGKGGCCAHVVR